MSVLRFKIDEKSLFYGIYNDYEKGQTATVSTPLNQSSDESKWHHDIMRLFEEDINCKALPERLVDICLRKTTSQANSAIDYFYEFKTIYLDGVKINTDSSFGMYVKRETDRVIVKRDGALAQNTHYGRLKLHYPLSLKFKGDGFNIDNKAVLEAIIRANGGFAYVVRGFEVDTSKMSLNFLTAMVGIEGVHLSSVFRIQKGVGKKLMLKEIQRGQLDSTTLLNLEDGYLVEEDYTQFETETDFDALHKVQAKNGAKGEKYVLNNLESILGTKCSEVYHTSQEFKKSPYDIEYIDTDGIKQYLEVKSTSGTKKYFNMSKYEINFMEKYENRYLLILVSEVNNVMPTINKYRRGQILSMKKEYPTTRFFA